MGPLGQIRKTMGVAKNLITHTCLVFGIQWKENTASETETQLAERETMNGRGAI